MGKLPGEPWQWLTAVASLVICFCLGVHCGRAWEHDPEIPDYSTNPADAAVKLEGAPGSNGWTAEGEQKILAALKREVSIELSETPFQQFLDYFRLETGLNCHLDTSAEVAMEQGGVARVHCNLNNVPLQSLLERVLRERKLNWTIADSVLLIVTDAKLETRVYPVRDLAKPPRFRNPNGPDEPIVDIIQRSIDPDSWFSMGGDGTIERLPNTDSLIIRQTIGVHEKIAILLSQIRKARQMQRQ